MANYCNNKLILSNSNPGKTIELYHLVKNGDPEKILSYFSHTLAQQENGIELQLELKEQFENSGWFEWQNKGAYFMAGSDALILEFDSSWQPPIQLYKFLSDNAWSVEAYYMEPNNEFCGKWDSESGDNQLEFDCNNIPPMIIKNFDLDPEQWRDDGESNKPASRPYLVVKRGY